VKTDRARRQPRRWANGADDNNLPPRRTHRCETGRRRSRSKRAAKSRDPTRATFVMRGGTGINRPMSPTQGRKARQALSSAPSEIDPQSTRPIRALGLSRVALAGAAIALGLFHKIFRAAEQLAAEAIERDPTSSGRTRQWGELTFSKKTDCAKHKSSWRQHLPSTATV